MRCKRRRHAHNGCRPMRCIFFSVCRRRRRRMPRCNMQMQPTADSEMQKTLKPINACAEVRVRMPQIPLQHNTAQRQRRPSKVIHLFDRQTDGDLVRECTCFNTVFCVLPNRVRDATAIYVPHQSHLVSLGEKVRSQFCSSFSRSPPSHTNTVIFPQS